MLSKLKKIGAVFALVMMLTLCFSACNEAETVETVSGELSITFLDVGQGDSALISCDDHHMLIDGGDRTQSSFMYAYLQDAGIDHLDYVIGSHPDEDHIGGLAGALNYATAEHVLCSEKSHDSRTFDNFRKAAEKQGVTIEIPEPGDEFSLGEAKCTVIGPTQEYEESNNNSLVIRIRYGKTSFLFTGDCENLEEMGMLDSGCKLSSTVLKVGHHGSSSSTSEEFLREVHPAYAVISVGRNNDYGHPTEETLEKLYSNGATVYRTDESGNITCKSDGERVTFQVEYEKEESATPVHDDEETCDYILNVNTNKFHLPGCRSVDDMNPANKQEFTGTRKELMEMGYSPCGNCKP